MAVGVRRANRPYMQPIGVPVTASVLPPPPSPAARATVAGSHPGVGAANDTTRHAGDATRARGDDDRRLGCAVRWREIWDGPGSACSAACRVSTPTEVVVVHCLKSSQKPTASARAPVRFDVAVLVRPLASATVSTTVQLRA